jgi:hypothetical protein
MKIVFRFVGVVALSSALSMAQIATEAVPTGPPACPVVAGGKPASPTRSKRPTAEQIKETAEAGAADPSVLMAAEPIANFGAERFRLADYAECVGGGGCYWADVDAQTRRAGAMLERAIATKKSGEKLAMVLDIDETSLTNYCEMVKEDYGYLPGVYEKWLAIPQSAMPIAGTLRLYDKARAAGLEVFFITGRADELRKDTERNLELAGFKRWRGLALRVGPQQHMPTAEYKSQERQKIVDAGYRIVLNMGDQWSDLNGTARGNVSVKLPNPFYYLP